MKFHGRVAEEAGSGIRISRFFTPAAFEASLLLLKTNQLCMLSSIRDDYRVIRTFNRNQFSVEIYW